MHDGVERQAAQVPRRRIAEAIGRPRMRRLVHGQRRNQHDELNENLGEIDAGQNLKRLSRHPRRDTADRVEQALDVGDTGSEIDDAGWNGSKGSIASNSSKGLVLTDFKRDH